MLGSLKRRLLLTGAVLALIAGGTLAALSAASTTAKHRQKGPLSAAADYLGVSASQLRGELRSGRSLAQVAQASPGHTSAGLEAALLAARRRQLAGAEARLPLLVAAEVKRPGGPAIAFAHANPAGLAPAASSYLGLSPAQLRAQLRSGRSLAQVAAAEGRSQAGLIGAIVAARTRVLAGRLASGAITRAQEDRRLSKLHARVEREVNRVVHLGARPRKQR